MLSILQLRHGVAIQVIWKNLKKNPCIAKLPPKMIVVALFIVNGTFNNDNPNYVSKIRLTSSKRKRFLDILTWIFINCFEKSTNNLCRIKPGAIIHPTIPSAPCIYNLMSITCYLCNYSRANFGNLLGCGTMRNRVCEN